MRHSCIEKRNFISTWNQFFSFFYLDEEVNFFLSRQILSTASSHLFISYDTTRPPEPTRVVQNNSLVLIRWNYYLP